MDPILFPSRKPEPSTPPDALDLFAQPTVEAPAAAPPSRALTLEERFERFHQANPHVYTALEQKARRHLAAGERYITIAQLFEELRADKIQTHGDSHGLNNSWRSHYSRLLIARVPGLGDVMRTRDLRAQGAA